MTVAGLENQNLINNYISQQKALDAAETAATEQSAKTDLIGNYDTFLKILTTQIKNQDPTEPMDASEFTNQLVQYSAVEQQINTNEKLDVILQNMNSNGITPLLGYVGQYTEVATENKMVVQGGTGLLAYNLPSNVSSVSLAIQDSSGKTVATIEGPTEQGLNRIAWDGQQSNGVTATDGVYKFVLTAKNGSGETVDIDDVRAIGQITGVETGSSGEISLKIGDLTVDDEDIKSVFASIGIEQDEEATS